MADTPAISVQNLAKAYRIWSSPAARLTSPLQHSIGGALPAALGGAALQRRAAAAYRDFWALQDISLTVKRGEAVGIIGRNGSGKSTLLQIIAGTLQPTSGTAQISGRVAALLELGAGFNGDYTGRENVLLNGAVLGLKPDEIEAKFDDIAAYADIGEFIDQPVRTYSTGMQMRLAFAVAAHVDADVLIIDEALSVGDARFQLKCAKTIDALVEQGKTLLFVSHDFFAVKRLCDRAILLDKGRLVMDDEPNPVVNHYVNLISGGEQETQGTPLSKKPAPAAGAGTTKSASTTGAADSRLGEAQQALARLAAGAPWSLKFELLAAGEVATSPSPDGGTSFGGRQGRIEDLAVLDRDGKASLAFLTGESATVRFVARANDEVPAPIYALTVKNTLGQDVYVTNTLYKGMTVPDVSAGQATEVVFSLQLNLMPGEYFLSVGWVTLVGNDLLVIHRRYDAVKFAILPVDRRMGVANLHSEITVTPIS